MSKEKVGYKNPPKKSQFKKGQSGNPAGRPKGMSSLDIILDSALGETVMVTEKGRKREITKLDAIVAQLVNKAVLGDPKSAKQILELHLKINAKELLDGKKEPLPWNDEM